MEMYAIHLPSSNALCMCYQPLLETGCWAPRTLGVTWHSCSSPVNMHFLLGGGRKKQQIPRSQCQREHLSLDQAPSHSWLCMIRERYFGQNEIGQRLESGHFSLGTNTSMHPSYFSSEKFNFQSERHISHTKNGNLTQHTLCQNS